LLLGDLGQQFDLQEQKEQIRDLRDQVRAESSRATASVEMRLDVLERNCDEMKLYLASLVRYLISKRALDPQEFETLVDEIDAEDGSSDGRFRGGVV